MWTTETSEGPIMSALYKAKDGNEYKFVVAVKIERKLVEYNTRIIPKRDNKGRLIYAVPGGGEYIEGVGLL